MGDAGGRERLTAGDWVGAAITGVLVIAVLAFPSATFAALFWDFGDAERLPWLTRAVVLDRWFPWAASLPPIFAIVLGLRTTATLGWRRAWLLVAFLFAGFALGLCFLGAYLPIFTLAGSIRAE